MKWKHTDNIDFHMGFMAPYIHYFLFWLTPPVSVFVFGWGGKLGKVVNLEIDLQFKSQKKKISFI